MRRRVDIQETARAARVALASAALDAHIRRTVDTFPPLTPERCERLAALLRGGTA